MDLLRDGSPGEEDEDGRDRWVVASGRLLVDHNKKEALGTSFNFTFEVTFSGAPRQHSGRHSLIIPRNRKRYFSTTSRATFQILSFYID